MVDGLPRASSQLTSAYPSLLQLTSACFSLLQFTLNVEPAVNRQPGFRRRTRRALWLRVTALSPLDVSPLHKSEQKGTVLGQKLSIFKSWSTKVEKMVWSLEFLSDRQDLSPSYDQKNHRKNVATPNERANDLKNSNEDPFCHQNIATPFSAKGTLQRNYS